MKRNKVIYTLLILVFHMLFGACSSPLDTEESISKPTEKPPTVTNTPFHFFSATAPPSAPNTQFPTATHSDLVKTAVSNGECIESFDAFAYNVPELSDKLFKEKILPLAPWQFETLIPDPPQNDVQEKLGVMMARIAEGRVEIWVIRSMWYGNWNGDDYITENLVEFWIYRPDTKEWKVIPADIEDTGVWVDQLFETKDGTVWGFNKWNPSNKFPLDNIPVLSIYNEKTERFEFKRDVVEFPAALKGSNGYRNWPIVILDQKGVFWIFIQRDALYSFDPATQVIIKHFDIAIVQEAALAPDGRIYFKRISVSLDGSLQDNKIFQFIPETGEVTSLELPLERWPYGEIMVDQDGRLWIGTIGWRELDGTWHLMHPNPVDYFSNIYTNPRWITPYIILESSNRILWLQKYSDVHDGTAWLDPQTGEGCWFTNLLVSIVEDPDHNLWLVADGKLYKYALTPKLSKLVTSLSTPPASPTRSPD